MHTKIKTAAPWALSLALGASAVCLVGFGLPGPQGSSGTFDGDLAGNTLTDTGGDLTVQPASGQSLILAEDGGATAAEVTSGNVMRLEYPWTRAQWGEINAFGATAILQGFGLCDYVVNEAGTDTRVTDATGVAITQDAAATTGSDCGWVAGGTFWDLQANPYTVLQFGLDDTTTMRFRAGLGNNGTLNNYVSADDPVVHFCGVAYSTDRSDTTFQFEMDDNSTHTVVDTGVSVSTDVYYLVVDWTGDGTACRMALMSSAWVELASHTFTSNLIDTSVDVRFVAACETRDNVSVGFRTYKASVVLRPD